MKKMIIMLSILAFVLTAPMAAQAAEKLPRLLLQDIQPKGIEEQVAQSLTDLLEMEIERGRLFEVVSQQDLRKLLQVEEQRILYGIEEGQEERMAAIAKKVNAPYALATSVGKVGSSYVLSLRLLDVNESKVVRRVNQTLIGEETGLIGSLRAAVLALTLEEKGIASDISAELINDLTIAEKDKTAYFALSPAWEVPMGNQTTSDGIVSLRPEFFHVRLDVDIPVAPWVIFSSSLSVGTTLRQESASDTNDIMFQSPAPQTNPFYLMQTSTTFTRYSTLRIPLSFGVKITPDHGRFLPFIHAGLGFSYQKFTFNNASQQILREQSNGTCPELFEEDIIDLGGGATQTNCWYDGQLKPDRDMSLFGMDIVAGVGLQWLFTQNFGVKAEARFEFTRFLAGPAKLRTSFSNEEQLADGTTVTTGKIFSVEQDYYGLSLSTGIVAYW